MRRLAWRYWAGWLFRGATSGHHSGRKRRREPRAPGLAIEVLETRLVPSFVAPRSYDVGSNPRSVTVADFNGDGIPDLAVANISSSTVSVLLGTGDGSFQPARSSAAGSGPISVAVGDFNGDGRLDLAVANYDSNTVSVLLGTGDGSFQPPRSFAAGSGPYSVAVGDFNGDGILDLAVALAGDFQGHGSGVDVLLGNGDGSFQPATTFAAGVSPESVVVGDFNGDGIQDLVVTNRGTSPTYTDGSVSVLLGNGDGTLQPAQTFAAGSSPDAVAVGDFNGDGIPDLVVAGYELINIDGHYVATNPSVRVLLGNGDGSFQLRYTRSLGDGSGPDAIAVGDFTGDGILDLALTGDGDVSVLLGNGDGSFQPARTFAFADLSPTAVAVGDFNGDGIPDLAAAGSGGVWVLLSNGDGTFQTPNFSYIAGGGRASVAAGDFDGNGWPDLAVTNSDSNDVSILLNDGVWTGPHPGSGGGAPAAGRFPGRGAGVPQQPAARHPAAVVEAQLAEVAFPDFGRAAPATALAEAAPALPPRDRARPASAAPPAPAPRRENALPPSRARPAARTPRPALLDLVFADGLAAGSDASPEAWAGKDRLPRSGYCAR